MVTPEQPPIRIGNQERENAVHALGEHFAHGRLDTDEFDDRVARAYGARTADDLQGLFLDLPRPAAPTQPTPFLGPQFPGPAYPVPWVAELAPFGWDPYSGRPYSSRSKIIAGVLQLLLPFGIGRFYTGHTGLALAQLLLSIVGIGVFWCWIDAILLLAGRPTDPYGRPLRS